MRARRGVRFCAPVSPLRRRRRRGRRVVNPPCAAGRRRGHASPGRPGRFHGGRISGAGAPDGGGCAIVRLFPDGGKDERPLDATRRGRRMRCVVARRRPIAVTQQAPAVAPADVADHLRRLPAGRDATERRRRTRRGAHRRARAVDVGGRTLCIRDRPVARIDSPDLARRLVAGRRRRDADESAHRRARDDVTMTAPCRRPDAPRRRPQAGDAAAPGRADAGGRPERGYAAALRSNWSISASSAKMTRSSRSPRWTAASVTRNSGRPSARRRNRPPCACAAAGVRGSIPRRRRGGRRRSSGCAGGADGRIGGGGGGPRHARRRCACGGA